MNIFSKPKYYRPGFGGSLLILLVMFLLGSVVSVVAAFIAAAITGELSAVAQSTSDPVGLAGILSGKLSLVYFTQMIIPVLFIWLVGNSNSQNPLNAPVKVDAPHLGKFNFLTLGILLLLMTLGLSWALDPVTSNFPIPDNFKDMFESIATRPVDTIVSVAIMAPLFEEFIMRGTIERGLLSKGSAVVAILWSALLFGAMHMNLWQAIPAFVLGCLFGWVYYRSHSIWAVIFMHFVNNFSSIMLFWAFPDMDADATSRENMIQLTGTDMWYWVLVGGGVAIVIVGIILLHKFLPRKPKSFKPATVILADAINPNSTGTLQ